MLKYGGNLVWEKRSIKNIINVFGVVFLLFKDEDLILRFFV